MSVIWKLQSQELSTSVMLSHQVCGSLLQQSSMKACLDTSHLNSLVCHFFRLPGLIQGFLSCGFTSLNLFLHLSNKDDNKYQIELCELTLKCLVLSQCSFSARKWCHRVNYTILWVWYSFRTFQEIRIYIYVRAYVYCRKRVDQSNLNFFSSKRFFQPIYIHQCHIHDGFDV